MKNSTTPQAKTNIYVFLCFLLLGNLSLFAQSDFTLRWSSEVYNMLGYLMNKRALKQTDGTLDLNMSAYTSGKYIVVLKHNGKIVKQLILIKE